MSQQDALPKKAILITPTSFYSFAGLVSQALQRAGYSVTIANDEYPNNIIGKILGKLRVQALLNVLTERVLWRDFFVGRQYDLTLIIKGRGIGSHLLQRIRPHAGRIVAYNFDSFAYHPAPLAWHGDVDKYCTFDDADAARHGLPLVPLFSSLPVDDAPRRIKYSVSAIMRNHSDRLQYLDRVLGALRPTDAFCYVFETNRVTGLLNFLQSPLLYLKYRHLIHFKSLPYGDYMDVLRSSDFTIDYAHPSQSGTTIRCFEAAGVQTKIITNNPNVFRNPQFDGENTIVFGLDTPGEELRGKVAALRGHVPPRRSRMIDEFIADLLR